MLKTNTTKARVNTIKAIYEYINDAYYYENGLNVESFKIALADEMEAACENQHRFNDGSIMPYQAAKDYIMGGAFACYYADARKELAEILEETEEEANKYSDDKVWNLFATACELIYRNNAEKVAQWLNA